MFRALSYFFSEARASLWRGRRAALLAVLTITAGLFVLGLFLIVTANLDALVRRWSEAAELSVYLRDDVSEEQLRAIDGRLNVSEGILRREYVSKEEALRRFKADFRDLATLPDTFAKNPLPASFEVRLRSTAAAGGEAERLAAELSGLPGVADVRYDRRWLDRLTGAVRLVQGIGAAVVAILALAAALTVANVVRLAAYTRRDEIEIMQLVGAPIAYVRGPFIVEGVLQGGAGAAIALAVLWAVFMTARARWGPLVANAVGLADLRFLSVGTALIVLTGGMALGCLGGFVAARAVK
jgi:cell division transport system permease protein